LLIVSVYYFSSYTVIKDDQGEYNSLERKKKRRIQLSQKVKIIALKNNL